MDPEKKLAHNEAMFREVNETVGKTAAESRYSSGHLPSFVCECSDGGCGELIELSLTQYEDVRRDPSHFVIKPGHDIAEIENVVERFNEYVVIEKLGKGRDAAEDTDPRAPGS